MLRNVLSKAAALLVLAIGASVASAQTQANLEGSANAAVTKVPGFAYKAELTVTRARVLWDFRVFGADKKAYKVTVDAPTATVFKAKKSSINKDQATSADVDLLEAAGISIDAIADKYEDDAQITEVALKSNKKKGSYWQVELKSTTDAGVVYEVKIDSKTGKVLKIELSDD